MRYVALLRGINVGGAHLVPMAQLKAVFEDAGMTAVRTFINSGNVIFSTTLRARVRITQQLEQAIARRFGFAVPLLLRDAGAMQALVRAIPPGWTNEGDSKCDVLFLWKAVDRPAVLEELAIRAGVDEVRYIPGALIWRVDRRQLDRTGMVKLAGTSLYRQMTVRNCNTVRKLDALLQS